MNKYLNIAIVAVFGLLTYNYGLGYAFYIPLITYFALKNKQNLILILPFAIASLFFFQVGNYITFILLFVSLALYSYLFNQKTMVYNIAYVTIINIITYLMIKYIYHEALDNFVIDIIAISIAPIIISFLLFNHETPNNIEKEIRSMSYNEVFIGIIIALGAAKTTYFDMSLGYILSFYFIMYYSSNRYTFSSLFYSVVLMFAFKYFYDLPYTIILPIISAIYVIPKLYSSLTLLSMILYCLVMEKDLIPLNIMIALMAIIIIFELSRPFSIMDNSKGLMVNNIYDKTITQVDNEVSSFALFLDKIVHNFADNEYYEELGEAINVLVKTHCNRCSKQSECFSKNKGKLYYFYKNLILNNKDDFFCLHYEELRLTSYGLNKNLYAKNNYAKDTLSTIMNSISNILRQYCVDHSLKEEIEYDKLYSLRQGLMDYGYSLSLFNVSKIFKNDFIVEVGLVGIVFTEEQKHIEAICNHYIQTQATVLYQKTSKNKTYFTVVPKTHYEVSYGYGSLAHIGNNVCGDNYLVKQLDSSKIIAIICDGMGKGVNANIQSTRALKLLDEITNAQITSETSLHILNSFYYIQDYQEKYSTLDFLEIDRQTGTALVYKAGATATYIIHEDGVIEKIENENLPFGLNEMIMSRTIQLNSNDLIVMASDGVFDNIINEKDFEDYIKSIRYMDPQKITYELLNYAKNTDVLNKDDMSVITLKIKVA